jgi:hypothetical protein
MKSLLSAAMIVAAAIVSFAQTNITVQVKDTSGKGSPIENVGSGLVSETFENGRTVDSIQYELKAKNTSEKPIMMFVEHLVVRYPSSHGERFIKERDTFFGRNPFGSGEVLDMGYTASGKLVHDNASSRAVEPSCEVRVMYVEFTDGSHFGEEKYAQHILDLRQQIWNRLGHLQYVYTKQGEKAYVDALQELVEPAEVNAFLDPFRESQKKNGTQKVIEAINRHLREAEDKSAQLLTHRE